ncbi:uncharacterized protein [Ptychodera flava]|uniref:uncharacterized protein n=1 Tax=Ptychodera flava TaxID=63121 RepID=UPI00396AA988
MNSKEFLEWINQEKSVGVHQIVVKSLRPPSAKHTIREIRLDYVKQIEEAIMKKPATLLAQPLLGIVSDIASKDAFNPALVNGYNINIIGGNHRREALQRLKTTPEVPVLLYVGCTDDEVVRLANLHNTVAQTLKFYDTIEKVMYCRKLLFELSNQTSEEPPKGNQQSGEICVHSIWKRRKYLLI